MVREKKKRGRPKVPAHKKRSYFIKFKVTELEKAEVLTRAFAAGRNVSEWVRIKVLG
jgi:hypothetical protein